MCFDENNVSGMYLVIDCFWNKIFFFCFRMMEFVVEVKYINYVVFEFL